MLTLYGRPIPPDRRDQFYGYEAMCGMLDGSISHSQTYGYWQMRVRLVNVSRGHHVSFWLLPTDGSWPPELDLMKAVGTNPDVELANRNTFWFSAHHSGPSGLISYRQDLTVRRPDAWHEIGLEWTPDKVTWYLNDRKVYELPAASFGTEPMSLMVSSEVSANWPGATTSATTWPMEVQVDYVRIYQKAPAPLSLLSDRNPRLV